MKKLFSCFLVLTLALSLMAGCGSAGPGSTAEPPVLTEAQEIAAQAPAQAEKTAVTVKTVDELLAALASDADITLEAGTYDLTTAADYGKESKNPAYTWVPSDDGYGLNISNLARLTIRGAGKDSTDIVTTPRHVNALAFSQCSELTLENLTVGHTEGAEMCSGGVVFLDRCGMVNLTGLGLFGCGTIGVDAVRTDDLTVSQCDIYECSYAGIRAAVCSRLAVRDTQIHDMKDEYMNPYATLALYDSMDVEFIGCSVTDCTVTVLADASNVQNITFENCEFKNNRVIEGGFRFEVSAPVFDNVTLTDNELRTWYTIGSATAVDPQGQPITYEEAAAEEVPVSSDLKQVHVSTVDEFLAAIGPDTEIILESELYDLSLASDYGKGKTDYYMWNESFDGPELVITNVSNLVISSSDGNAKAHTVSATPRYADVLSFKHCSNIKVSGFTAGHTKEPGSCSGGVLWFEDSDGITVEKCGLFGCGIIGVQAQYCSNIHVLGCDIYECSIGGIRMDNIKTVRIDECTFRDLGSEYGPGYEINLYACENATVDGEPYEPGF